MFLKELELNNLYSQSWFLNEIENIKKQNLKNLKIDLQQIKISLNLFIKLDSRDPLKISNDNWLFKILKNIEEEPFSLEKYFKIFNSKLDLPITFEDYLSFLRAYDEYKNHLNLTYFYICNNKREFKKEEDFDILIRDEVAKKLEINHANYINFINRIKK